jgi:hypothetical protein
VRRIAILFAVAIIFCGCEQEPVEAHKLPGEHIMSKTAQAFLDQLDTEPTIEEMGPMQPYFYRFYDKGVELYLDGDTIFNVLVYPKGIDNYTASYSGKLPYGLTLSDSRNTVEKKLGTPATTQVTNAPWLISSWPGKEISVIYRSTDMTDMDNKIHHIVFVSNWIHLKKVLPREG